MEHLLISKVLQITLIRLLQINFIIFLAIFPHNKLLFKTFKTIIKT